VKFKIHELVVLRIGLVLQAIRAPFRYVVTWDDDDTLQMVQSGLCLDSVGLISIVISRIAPHPPNLAQLFFLVSSENVKVTDHIIIVLIGKRRVGMEGGTDGQGFEDGFDCG
jgi:hypothetical protein